MGYLDDPSKLVAKYSQVVNFKISHIKKINQRLIWKYVLIDPACESIEDVALVINLYVNHYFSLNGKIEHVRYH